MLATLLILTFLLTSISWAHEDAAWIAEQQLRNKMGEFCCGPKDCVPVDKGRFYPGPGGYIIPRQPGGGREELIPYSEAMPLSPDGRLWICRRANGSRSCVFDLPPGM